MCAFGLIDQRDWHLVQDFIFTSEKNAKAWLGSFKKSLDSTGEEFIQIEKFIQNYLQHFNS